jgi:hypothetical protein
MIPDSPRLTEAAWVWDARTGLVGGCAKTSSSERRLYQGAAMRRMIIATASLAVLIVLPRVATAGDITYTIQNYPADQQGATLSGTITTDGVIGNLAPTDILSWMWTITYPGGTPFTLSSSDAGTQVVLLGSIVASQSSLTIGAPAPGGFNAFDLYAPEANSSTAILSYARNSISGSPTPNIYEGSIVDESWLTYPQTLGGLDPWVIARVASAVPEPSGVVLLSLGVAGLLLGRTSSRSIRPRDWEREADRRRTEPPPTRGGRRGLPVGGGFVR